ncbi:MAG: exo-alpha-sialidase, partial [Planctomycetota bacterium]|nr:exo-alpha-sialidase [Planctomycetota bacterium]
MKASIRPRVRAIAPVLMRAPVGADLTDRDSWTFADHLAFRDAVDVDRLDGFGVPFYPEVEDFYYAEVPGRECTPIGWLETNVV